jgi:hypothetical protein
VTYKPTPLDTSNVPFPDFLDQLVERLAENVHEVWARGRLAEGWRLGPQRNDDTKEHPNLVPFDELPEVEKEVDRRTAVETLKMILAIGYRIEKP